MQSIHYKPGDIILSVLLVLWFGSFGIQKHSQAEDTNNARFALTDHNGKQVTETDFAEYFLLIFFGYSHCPDICPLNLTTIGHTMNLLGKDSAKVQPIFVTLDPERDTPNVLKPFVLHFHPRMIGLTGNVQQIQEIATTFFVRYKHTGVDGNNGYLLDHTAATYLISPQGEGLLLFPHDTPASEMVAALHTYIAP